MKDKTWISIVSKTLLTTIPVGVLAAGIAGASLSKLPHSAGLIFSATTRPVLKPSPREKAPAVRSSNPRAAYAKLSLSIPPSENRLTRSDFEFPAQYQLISFKEVVRSKTTVVSASPVNIALMFDNSASMDSMTNGDGMSVSRMESALSAGSGMIDALPKSVRLSVGSFQEGTSTPVTVGTFSDDRTSNKSELDAIAFRQRGGTNLYEGLAEAVTAVSTQPGKREVIMVVDGEGFGDPALIDEILVTCQRESVRVSFVLILASVPPVIEQIAKRTGGLVVTATDRSSLDKEIRRIGSAASKMEKKYAYEVQLRGRREGTAFKLGETIPVKSKSAAHPDDFKFVVKEVSK